MRRILTVTLHTLFAAGATGYLTIAGILLTLGGLNVYVSMQRINAAKNIGDQELAWILTREMFTNLTGIGWGMLIFIAFTLGNTIAGEIKQKTFHISLTKISRWRFCSGVLLGGASFIICVGLILMFLSTILGMALQLELSSLYFVGVTQSVSLALAIASISLAVGACLPLTSWLRKFIWIGLFAYFIAHAFPYPWRTLYDIAFYMAPCVSKVDLVSEGLISSRLDVAMSLELMVIAENLLYSGLMFGLAIWGFSRRELGAEKLPKKM